MYRLLILLISLFLLLSVCTTSSSSQQSAPFKLVVAVFIHDDIAESKIESVLHGQYKVHELYLYNATSQSFPRFITRPCNESTTEHSILKDLIRYERCCDTRMVILNQHELVSYADPVKNIFENSPERIFIV